MSSAGSAAQLESVQPGAVLLDIERDRILKLNPVGKEIWNLLCSGCKHAEIVAQISCKYTVPAERVEKDLALFIARIKELGLTPEQQISHRPDQPSVTFQHHPWYGRADSETSRDSFYIFLALLGLFLFDVVLALFSLKTLCSCVKSWPIWQRKFGDDEIKRICAAVDSACIWYPKTALCFQRSAVTTCLLRLRGVPAKMVSGVRDMPLLAHAWVEVNGSVINDWPKVQSFYRACVTH